MSAAPVAPVTLAIRRSIHIKAEPMHVWRYFESFDQMNRWWGVLLGPPEAGKGNGQRLVKYDPHVGGDVEMEVSFDGLPVRYGGSITVFEPGREITFESDWKPNRGWKRPTLITLRLTPAFGGTVVELLHHGFERTGANFSDEFEGYEAGWSTTQLSVLRRISQAEE
jgi:uncharacterized protein YndB with AHSA1/START domain